MAGEGRTQAQHLHQPPQCLSRLNRRRRVARRHEGDARTGLPCPSISPAGIEHVVSPTSTNEGRDDDDEAFAARLSRKPLKTRILEVGPENVAAFIGEPIQGAGGVIIPPRIIGRRSKRSAGNTASLLVCDEVICGFGRTGNMVGHEALGVKPDIIAMAKGLSSGYLPISAVAVSAEIVEVLKTGGDFVHGYTYSGHPVASAVALRNIEIIDAKASSNAPATKPGRIWPKLWRLTDHPLVGEVRSAGLLGAVEIVADKATNERFGGQEGTAGPMVRDVCIERPDGARHPRQHRHVSAADHHHGADRRI